MEERNFYKTVKIVNSGIFNIITFVYNIRILYLTMGASKMKVYLLKDVEKVGFAGTVVKVSEGFGRNFLIAKKLAIEVTPQNEGSFAQKMKVTEHKKEVVETKTSMLAEKIKELEISIKRKMHDGEKLYGSISAQDIVELLAEKGVSVQKNQVIFDKSIKTKGTHNITIKLSSKLQPKFTLKVQALA